MSVNMEILIAVLGEEIEEMTNKEFAEYLADIRDKAENWDSAPKQWRTLSESYSKQKKKIEAIKQVIKDVADGELNPYDGVPMDNIREILRTSCQTAKEVEE